MEGDRDGKQGGGGGKGRERGKKRKNPKYLSSINARRKNEYGLRNGTQGFLVTCDKGRERATIKEVVNLLDEFYERLVEGGNAILNSTTTQTFEPSIINGLDPTSIKRDEVNLACNCLEEATNLVQSDVSSKKGSEEEKKSHKGDSSNVLQNGESRNTPVANDHAKNIDDVLEAELSQLRDRKKARFSGYDTGCIGIVFVEMLRGDVIRPLELVLSIVETIAMSKQSRTRYTLRLLPVEVTCYASASEVKKAAEPVVLQYFPKSDDSKALKYAIVYEARANTSLERMEIINAVAELVPKPHSVDLKNPDMTIIVQILKTTCALGIARKFKEMAKYNLKQLVLPKVESQN